MECTLCLAGPIFNKEDHHTDLPKIGTLENFFMTSIVSILQSKDVNEFPMLKAGTLKFFTMFWKDLRKHVALHICFCFDATTVRGARWRLRVAKKKFEGLGGRGGEGGGWRDGSGFVMEGEKIVRNHLGGRGRGAALLVGIGKEKKGGRRVWWSWGKREKN
ncbi:unnamed protein product [Prunus armeniaca]|uniref:Exportin-2 central domain-containing protein n=1 Tax=Prunus armeniaca TaxID=36596 RepID=A0A6J5WL32_PRUAR|nr:unnamed protein product [Prunus armeniaca]